MRKSPKKRPGKRLPAANLNRRSRPRGDSFRSPQAGNVNLARNKKLIEQIRQIIEATPEIRPEKVGPLKEAVDEGTYEIDARELAKVLITKLILEL
jgi:flagellar biosynthesis anti-sigma factor FlgM